MIELLDSIVDGIKHFADGILYIILFVLMAIFYGFLMVTVPIWGIPYVVYRSKKERINRKIQQISIFDMGVKRIWQ